MASSHDSNHFISHLEYLEDILQQLNKVNLKLQSRGRTVVDFTETYSSFVKNLTVGSENLKQDIFLFRESCHGVS